MYVKRLALENFRNFAGLELDLTAGRTVIYGGNAQGKTNLLEAVHMLATAKSTRAGHEREIINWQTLEDEIPYARVTGEIERSEGPLRLEIVVQLTRLPTVAANDQGDEAFQFQKRARINGAPRRASDLVGEMNAVLFAPQDIELVHGPPSIRRHYLDITLCQIDRPLLRQLQRYARVLAQRNNLLRAIREGNAAVKELEFWDNELVDSGAFITLARRGAMRELGGLARAIHGELTGGSETLEIEYTPSVAIPEAEDGRDAFRRALEVVRERELRQAVSLAGPHRDDFHFLGNERPLAAYGSRGQQRTASLSLKLAEARFMAQHRHGDQPVLLLDDVFSELDSFRQGYLLSWVAEWGQALLTTAEPGRIDPRLVTGAVMLEVSEGRVSARARQ